MALSLHQPLLERTGAPSAACSALASYLDLLAAWAQRVNLTGAGTPERRVAILVEPALALLPLLLPGALLDVGSGNGSPGLVLALLEPARPVTLLEPRARRWAFLREAARACGRADIDVRRERHEQYQGAPAPNVTVRALRLAGPDLERLIGEGGQALLSWPLPGARPLPAQAGRRIFAYRPADVSRET